MSSVKETTEEFQETPTLRFLRACRGLPVDCTPVWFMRQAGRYMDEYQAVRRKYTLLEIVARPEVAAEVTLQPVERLGVDAAILFADILLPLEPLGIRLEFASGEGPLIHNPIRGAEDVRALRRVRVEDDLGHVFEAIRITRRALGGRTALIGFAGAPFTLACYMIDGASSRDFRLTKRFMYNQPDAWSDLMTRLAQMIKDYLNAQAQAGAQALQLFDTWAGVLSPQDYDRYVRPYSAEVFSGLKDSGVPLIHFGAGTSTILSGMQAAGGDVIGLDWRIPLDEGRKRLAPATPVQGNLDPVALFAPLTVMKEKVADVLRRAEGQPGHIFNLGHGILPGTPVDAVRAVVEMVHDMTGKR